MEALTILENSPTLLAVSFAIVGLMIGSFLNVIIYRLPVMMEKNWRKECLAFLEQETETDTGDETFNLAVPRSSCPKCGSTIRASQNIPVISYFLLKGRCANCQTKISVRYPLIEAFTGLASAMVAWEFGFSVETFYALLLTWSLISLSFIDLDHQLLPDSITLPLLWLGLLLSLFNVFTDSHSSIVGAAAGYLILWTVYQAFKLLTGKEGMGFGDFKLLAMLGAWLGWQYLPLILLLSSLVGALIGSVLIIFVKRDRNVPIPFGPYLATAGWIALLWGDSINRLYLHFAGLQPPT